MLFRVSKFAEKLFGFLGYRIMALNNGIHVDMDPEFKEIYELCKDYTATTMEEMYSLYKAVEYVTNSKIQGDFVECGVWKGGSSMIMAKTLSKLNDSSRKIYLYDTYSGMTEPGDKDLRIFDSLPAINVWKRKQKANHNSWSYSSLEEVQKNMALTEYTSKNLVYVKGKVEETISKEAPKKIALLRLDTDWYESTYCELVQLYPLLAEGGVLIIDDYGHWKGAKEAVDKYLKENNIKTPLIRLSRGNRLLIKN